MGIPGKTLHRELNYVGGLYHLRLKDFCGRGRCIMKFHLLGELYRDEIDVNVVHCIIRCFVQLTVVTAVISDVLFQEKITNCKCLKHTPQDSIVSSDWRRKRGCKAFTVQEVLRV